MALAASILFDASYIEPALVTAYELIGRSSVYRDVYLIYLYDAAADNSAAGAILQDFCTRFSNQSIRFSAIALANTLPSFTSSHFNNSIIYKALIPSVLPHEPYVLNIDAGILFGDRFAKFIAQVDDELCRENCGDWVLAAHCHDPDGLIPPVLTSHQHHRRYPAGCMLLFNGQAYRRSQWHNRFIDGYLRLAPHLRLAEQELMCLTAADHELVELPGTEERVTPFLGLQSLQGSGPLWPASSVDDCLFFKIVGTLKPWKYWVLDPNKTLWTHHRARLEKEFPLKPYTLIEQNRHSVSHEPLRRAFLEAYDAYLCGRPPTAKSGQQGREGPHIHEPAQ